MTIRTNRLTVGAAAAVELTGADDDYRGGSSIDVHVITGTLYVGGPGVTAANGRPVPAGGSYALDLNGEERLFGVTATGTADVAVLRAGV